MGVMERYEENKKKKQNTSDNIRLGVQERHELNKLTRDKSYEVNQDFINSFISDANNFLGSAEEEYGNVGWANASSVYDTRYNSFLDLYSKSTAIRRWLDNNKNDLDAESYSELSEAIDSVTNGVHSVTNSFKSKKDYFSQWDNEDAYNEYAKRQKEIEDILNSEDFEHYSQIGANIKNPSAKDAEPYFVFFGWKPSAEYPQNIVTYSRDNLTEILLGEMNGGGSEVGGRGIYGLLKDEEVSVYNYYLGKGEREKADKFLASLEDTLQRRQGEKFYEASKDSKALQMTFAVAAGLDQFASGIKNIDNYIKGTEGDQVSSAQYASSMIRQDLDGAWGTAYDFISTTSNMLPSILVSYIPVAGQAAGLATMGASAVGNAYAEMRNLGYDANQARTYATLVGASETTLQAILGGFSKLGGVSKYVSKFVSKLDNALARIAIGYGINIAAEGLEEGIQTAIEPVFKSWATGEDFEAAEWDDILYSALLGSLSAGFLEGAPTALGGASIISSNIDAKKTYGSGADLVTEAIDVGGEAKALAEKYQKKLDSGKELSGGKINNLLGEIDTAIRSDDTTKIRNAILKTLGEYGETTDVTPIADVLVKYATGEKLTSRDYSVLNNSDKGHLVLSEFNKANIQSGGLVNDWASRIGTKRISIESYNKDIYDLAKMMSGVREDSEKGAASKTIDDAVNAKGEKFDASDSGKTIYKDAEGNHHEVTVNKVVSTKGGLKVELDDGNTVSAKDLTFGSESEALMYEMVARMDVSPDTATEFVKTFKPTNDKQAAVYFSNVPLAYKYGTINYEAGLKNVNMPEIEKRIAFNRGKADAIAKAKQNTTTAPKSAQTAKTENSDKTGKNGIVYEDGFTYDEATANEMQKVSMAHIEVIDQVSNLEVHIFESKIEDGKRVAYVNGKLVSAPNGYFKDGNKIYIDFASGNNGEGAMLYTMSHEISHYIRKWNAKGFKELGDFLIEQYGKKGVPVNSLIEAQKETIRKRYKDEKKTLPSEAKLFDMAYEELVADAMSDMLTDPKAYEKLMKLKQKNHTLWAKLGEAIKAILDKFKSALGIYKNGGVAVAQEAHEVRGFSADAYEKLQDLYLKAFVEADANYEASIGTRNLNDIADAQNENGEPLLQYLNILASPEDMMLSDRDSTYLDAVKRGDMKTAQRMVDEAARDDIRFCERDNSQNEFNPKGETLKEQLTEALETSQSFERRYVYVGLFTQGFIDKLKKHIDIKKYPIVMNYRDAYLSMESKERGKYHGENINYHNLGVDGLEAALLSFDDPEYVLLSSNKSKIELVLQGRDYKNRQLFAIVEVNTKTQNNQKFMDVHVVTSVYGNRGLKNRIIAASQENRVIYKKEEESTQGMPQVQYKRDINANSSTDRIPQKPELVKGEDEYIPHSDRTSYAPTFYSHMGKVIDDIRLEKMGAGGVVSYLKGKGVKDEEIKWSGIEAFLEGKKSVTKADLQEFVAGSQLQIEEERSDGDEVQLIPNQSTGKLDLFVFGELRDSFVLNDNGEYESADTDMLFTDEKQYIESIKEDEGIGAKWRGYKLDGGENYREIVFKMPNSSYSNSAMRAHWGDDAEGVLAHARIQDMTTSDGKKMLFIEEIQSDWHNEGAKSGYLKEDVGYAHLEVVKENGRYSLIPKGTAKGNQESETALRERMGDTRVDSLRRQLINIDNAGAVPDAPFRNTYHEYVLKRLLRMAAEEGYDSIGWTTADIQSKRWSEQYAEGYRIEYDQDIPKFLRKYGKKWGATVGKTELPSLNPSETYYDVNRQEEYDSFPVWQDMVRDELQTQGADVRKVLFTIEDDKYWIAYDKVSGIEYDRAEIRKTSGSVWSMDITDSMTESVLYEGQVLYSDRNPYSYDALISKDELEVKELTKLTEAEIKKYQNDTSLFGKEMRDIAASVKNRKNTSTKTYLHCRDLGADVLITKDSFKHGAARMDGAYILICKNIATVLNNSIVVNELKARGSTNGGYVLLGMVETDDSYVVVRSLVNKRTWKLDEYEELDAIKKKSIKKEDVGLKPPNYIRKNGFGTSSVISIADFLGFVNSQNLANSVLSLDVIEKLNSIRGFDENITPNLVCSDRNPNTVSNRTLLANALESVAQNDIEKNKLAQYKAKIALIEAEQAKFNEIKEKANEIRFTKGRTPIETKTMRDLEFEANQIANRISTYDKQLLSLESTTALKNVLEREKKMLRKRLEQKGKLAIKAQKEKDAKTIRSLMDRHTESRKKAIEGRHKTEMRNKIKKVVSDLNHMLLHPTKEQHVPIGLQLPVAEALDAINMDSMNAGERVAYYNDLIAKSNNPDEIAMLTKKRDFFEYRDANFKERITALKNAYAEFKESDDPLIRNAHNDAIEDLIKNTADAVGNKSLKDMSLDQLDAVHNMYKALLATVRNSNKMFKESRQATVTENSESVKSEVREVGGHKDRVLKITKLLKKFGWNMLKPVTAMKVVGSKTFESLFANVRAGEDTWAADVSEAKTFYEEVSSKYKYRKWDFKKRFSFKDSAGIDFSLSLEQIMSLYAYSKRDQADRHLEVGGFIFDDAIEVTEKGKFGIPMKYEVNDANPYRLRKEDLASVVEALSPEQKAFVDEMQTYLSDVMGAKGNEVSLAMYDIKLYNETNYFPLKTSRYFREFDPEMSGTPKIKNSGFSKKTVPQAGNPIVLANFMDVWATHVNDMSMYHAFVLPLEDFLRVYNYSSTAGGYDSVQQYIKNAYGSQANQYIEKLMDDINGGARVDSSAGIINKGIALFKKAAVFASASVTIQQPSAIARAFAYINSKYFVTSAPSALNLVKHKALWNEVKKYAPVAIIKEMGYFDTGIGRSTVEWIKGNHSIRDKVDDVLSKAPAIADELSWTYLWEAVKKETKATTNLKVGSEEFLKKCGERFTEVITNTQVYDSVLSRSGMMRSKDTGMRMATAFMAEPTTTLNMMVDGIIQGKRGNKKFTASTIGAVSSSIILNSLLVSLVYAARDDDEDETYAEKYVESLTSEILDGFNPVTYIPIVKDAWSIMQGFDVERADMTLVTKFVDSLQQVVTVLAKDTDDMTEDELDEYRREVNEAVLSIIDNATSLMGIPVKNIRRDINAFTNTVNTLGRGDQTTAGGLKDAVGEAAQNAIPVWGWLPDEKKTDKLYDAIVSGDEVYAERIKKSYKSEDAYESAVRKALKDNDSRIHEAAQARLDGDISTYTRIAKEIIAEGNFSQDTVIGAINAEMSAIKKGESTETTEIEDKDEATSIYKASDVNAAFDNGDTSTALEIIDDLVKTKVANGKTEKEAKSSVKSSMTSYWKPLYKEAYQSGDTSEMARIRQILFSSGLYGTANEVVKTVQNWLED